MVRLPAGLSQNVAANSAVTASPRVYKAKIVPRGYFTALRRYGSVCAMPPSKFPAFQGHILPPTVRFTLADGTCLTAAVRPSARARNARMSLTPRGALVLTAPQSMDEAQLKASLPHFLPWLERLRKAAPCGAARPELPQKILLPLTNQEYVVTPGGDMADGRRAAGSATASATGSPLLLTHKAQRLLLLETPETLRLFGAVENADLCAKALRQWARQAATRLLPPFLEHLAATGGFALESVRIRDQRGRWGSCSRRRPEETPKTETPTKPARGFFNPLGRLTAHVHEFFAANAQPAASRGDAPQAIGGPSPAARINLNWRALLLPVPLLEHLCWHELCHLRHMNHSAAFRAELARYSPQQAACEKALGKAWRTLPWWALPEDGAPSAQP